MGAIDTEVLLQEISSDSPCGEDLEYDPTFIELENIAKGKAEQQIGDSIIEAESADWKQVQKQSLELLTRTKDIRILIYLIQASMHTDGYHSFSDGLTVLKELLEQYWEPIHPQLDEGDEDTLLHPLRLVPLVSSRMLGQFSLRDIAIATGEISPPTGHEPVKKATIDAAFTDADLEELQATANAVRESIDNINAIEIFVTEQVGVANATSFSELADLLKEAQQILTEQLARRGVGNEEESSEESGLSATETGVAAPSRQSLSGEINSRGDVIKALEKIEGYYARNEPASPVPLLTRRAKKLVPMDFMEIIKNLAPDGESQIETIRGPEDEGQDESW